MAFFLQLSSCQILEGICWILLGRKTAEKKPCPSSTNGAKSFRASEHGQWEKSRPTRMSSKEQPKNKDKWVRSRQFSWRFVLTEGLEVICWAYNDKKKLVTAKCGTFNKGNKDRKREYKTRKGLQSGLNPTMDQPHHMCPKLPRHHDISAVFPYVVFFLLSGIDLPALHCSPVGIAIYYILLSHFRQFCVKCFTEEPNFFFL